MKPPGKCKSEWSQEDIRHNWRNIALSFSREPDYHNHCNSTIERTGQVGINWRCTRSYNHSGPHVGHWSSGEPCAIWLDGDTAVRWET